MGVISLGLGSPASIALLTLFGLSPTGPVASVDVTADVIIQVRADATIISVRRDVGIIKVRPDVGEIEI
jgi:hypothetical protein